MDKIAQYYRMVGSSLSDVSVLCAQVKQFSCKSVDMSLRVASLDYLGIVAARLRRDAVSSQLNEDIISDIIRQVCLVPSTLKLCYLADFKTSLLL